MPVCGENRPGVLRLLLRPLRVRALWSGLVRAFPRAVKHALPTPAWEALRSLKEYLGRGRSK